MVDLSAADDEQQIFDTINSLGVDLTVDKLLKNFLYKAEDEETYRTSWNPMFDTNEARSFWGSDAASRKQKKNEKVIDRFLYAYVRNKMWDFKLMDNDRKEFVKEDNVYTACKEFVHKYGMTKKNLLMTSSDMQLFTRISFHLTSLICASHRQIMFSA